MTQHDLVQRPWLPVEGEGAVRAAAAMWIWILFFRFLQSAVDGCAATTSPTTWGAAPWGSLPALATRASLAGAVCRRRCAPGGADPCPRRRGRSVRSCLASRSSAPAPVPPTRLSCAALDRCAALQFDGRQQFFERALRFDSHEPRQLTHILLTALARVAQWTGIYALVLVALALTGILAILSSTSFSGARRPHLPLMTSVTPKY